MAPEATPEAAPLLLFTRPADEWARGEEKARAAGVRLLFAPLLSIEPLSFVVPDGRFDALLFTSPRAPAPFAAAAPALRALPCWCVGPRTAAAARAAGYSIAGTGETDGAATVNAAFAAGARRLLQPCGATRIALPLPDGLRIEPLPVYRAIAATCLPAPALAALAGGEVSSVLLFSPRSARIFSSLADAAGLPRAAIRLAALSVKVAAAAGPGWRDVAIATHPDLDSILRAACTLSTK